MREKEEDIMAENISIINQGRLFWKFLGFFQSPFLRSIHALVAVLVALQIISSLGMESNAQPGSLAYFFNTYHIGVGVLLVFISLFFIAYSLNSHGLRHFFPYLWGDVARLKKDVSASLHFKLVAPRPGGLAAAVQGLGLGALFLAVGSGIIWYLFSFSQSPLTPDLLRFHKAVVVLIGLYFIGHGVMAVLHFIVWEKNISKKAQK